MVKNNRHISLMVLILFIVFLLIRSSNDYYKSGKYDHQNPYFYKATETRVTYEGYFYPYSYREIWQDIGLSITELYSFKNGNLYALELDQLEGSDPLDEIKAGRRYVGYFYVTDQIIYYMPSNAEGYTKEKNRKIINYLKTNEKEFCDNCFIVCCESGTEDITDDNGYHSFVEVDGEKRIFRYYNDYFYGSKEYLLIVWEEEKGIVYYMRGNGAMNMHVEFGVDLKKEQQTDYGNPYRMFHEAEKVTKDVDTKEDTVQKIAQCLWEQVPELEDWSVYVEKESGGKAYLYQRYGNEKEDVYRNGEGSEYLGKYYSVYVGEMWEDHSVMWGVFYVSENFDEVLWKDTLRLKGSDVDMYSLEEWRNSSFYPQLKE